MENALLDFAAELARKEAAREKCLYYMQFLTEREALSTMMLAVCSELDALAPDDPRRPQLERLIGRIEGHLERGQV